MGFYSTLKNIFQKSDIALTLKLNLTINNQLLSNAIYI